MVLRIQPMETLQLKASTGKQQLVRGAFPDDWVQLFSYKKNKRVQITLTVHPACFYLFIYFLSSIF